MTTYPGWTPASRPGIVPLHPLGFGMILGRSFTALRQNPKVLLGFAMCTQIVGYLLMIFGVGAVALWSFSRLDTLQEGTDQWNAVFAGSTALTIIAGVVLGLAVTALGVIVQGVVVAEVSREVVAEKQSLGQLWARVKPALWRLFGYTLLLTILIGVLLGVFALVLFAIASMGTAALALAVILTVLLIIAAIPLTLWLSTKLLLVPAVLVLERTTISAAIVRSWTLIRGRFWPALGITLIIAVTISAVAQVVSIPFSLLSTGFSTIIAPTGADDPTAIVGIIVGMLFTQAIVVLIQAMGVIVQATASSLIYIDCRMRREGLDIDLLSYVDKRDAGERDLPDPYEPHPDRPHAPRPPYGYGSSPFPAYTPTAAYGPPPPGPAYGYPGPAYGQFGPPPPLPPVPSAAPQTATPSAPAATQWAAPGEPAPDGDHRVPPWH